MATPRTGRPPGRPGYNFLRDAERFAVAFVDALTVLDVSETDAFKIAAAQIVGTPVRLQTVGPRRKRGRGAVSGGTVIGYEQGSILITGKADTLRRKFKMYCTPEIVAWRVAMGRAFLLTLTAKKNRIPCAAAKIEELTASVGETGYAEAVLLPMLAARLYARRLT